MGQGITVLESPECGRKRLLRMLCLSGHASKSEITEMQTMHLQLAELHGVELDFIDGPFSVDTAYEAQIQEYLDGPFFTWSDPKLPLQMSREQLGEAIQYILDAVYERGPFDGLYGFSMGALVAALASEFLEASQNQLVETPPVVDPLQQSRPEIRTGMVPWRFMLAACGTCLDSANDVPGQQGAKPLRVNMPSFHVVGALDPIRDRSVRLSKSFQDVASHEMNYAGHSIPNPCLTDAGLTSALSAFFNRMHAAC